MAQMFAVYTSASFPVISLVVLNLRASRCTLVVTVASMSSLQFVKRNCFPFEMKGFRFPSCCPCMQPLQQKLMSLNTELE